MPIVIQNQQRQRRQPPRFPLTLVFTALLLGLVLAATGRLMVFDHGTTTWRFGSTAWRFEVAKATDVTVRRLTREDFGTCRRWDFFAGPWRCTVVRSDTAP